MGKRKRMLKEAEIDEEIDIDEEIIKKTVKKRITPE